MCYVQHITFGRRLIARGSSNWFARRDDQLGTNGEKRETRRSPTRRNTTDRPFVLSGIVTDFAVPFFPGLWSVLFLRSPVFPGFLRLSRRSAGPASVN